MLFHIFKINLKMLNKFNTSFDDKRGQSPRKVLFPVVEVVEVADPTTRPSPVTLTNCQ